MVRWHHQLNGHEFEEAPGVVDGQGGLTCCSPWGRKELDVTEQQQYNLICFLLVPRDIKVSVTLFAPYLWTWLVGWLV